ncbi:helix-turn-helix transcriptional regulator [Dyadobacter fanqingshengii]|uniref:Helix-turn-helix domain-containing protein n=1 Tax=Dyadobacter fanqingshengii TaxID=2906443 RepID=A0A9X1PAF0_9BACT|nr:helix-turn-helix transcriptional regulator [Dyadobacter fanqingshengii]MCF0040975.1 helix-turn-helix domain-containing protein [Dyadobacter fanqingshengii]USJ37294.1 helix-turn-helix domain-containing protein [Dyadobacter fanqingshengii]
MDLNDKIKQILTDKNISPSLFADEIGIQRSSMSHILAGRNKPSLDIVQKIVKRFPELGTSWILDDEDLPQISADFSGDNRSGQYPTSDGAANSFSASSKSNTKRDANRFRPSANAPITAGGLMQSRRIEKILIFYSDGTFEEVKPA